MPSTTAFLISLSEAVYVINIPWHYHIASFPLFQGCDLKVLFQFLGETAADQMFCRKAPPDSLTQSFALSSVFSTPSTCSTFPKS